MLTESNTPARKFEISTVQKFLFNVLLFVIPWFVIPLPWDITERSKALFLIGITTLILLLEVIKWIWAGKITILKSPFDGAVLLCLVSILLSSVFAKDSWISMWGFDGKLGSGLFASIFLFGMFYLFREFLSSKEAILRSIQSLIFGISVLALISILSFFKVGVFNIIPLYKDILTVGLPLTFSFQSMMLASGVAVLLGFFVIVTFLKNKQYSKVWYMIFAEILNLSSFIIFSINQGVIIPLIFALTIVFLAIVFMFKLDKKEKYVPITLFVVAALTLGLSIGIQFSSFRTALFGSDFQNLTPLTLGQDITWTVSTSALSSNITTGIFGLGNDSFAVAYSYFKPLSTDTLSLGNTTFSFGSSEILTILSNRGLFGVAVWIFLAVTVIKVVIKDLEDADDEKDSIELIPMITLLFLVISSLVAPFTIFVYVLFFAVMLFALVSRSLGKRDNDFFVIKFWAVDMGGASKNMNKSMNSINWFLTGVFVVIAGIVEVKVLSMTVSTLYLLKAESYSVQESAKYTDADPTIDQRSDFLNTFLGYYDTAAVYDSNNELIHRKIGLISLEVLNIYSEKYSDATDDEKKDILNNVSAWKNAAIEASREAINISPYSYANWNARASIYVGLVGVGLSDYSTDALSALQQCISLAPTDYASYYQMGQVYMVTEDYDKSLSAFNQALNINGQHVPSLVFAAQILSQQKKDNATAISYLDAAKQILETNKQEDTDLYKNIVDSLSKLNESTPTTDDTSSSSE